MARDGPPAPRLLLADPLRMMQAMFTEPIGSLDSVDRWFGDFSPSMFQPVIDVVDDDDVLRITAELPGMERQDVKITIEDGALVLRGEKKLESVKDEKGCYRTERAFGRFERVVPLPDDLDLDNADATFDKGVLTITIPKTKTAEESGKRELQIH
jgi:HSP20 family protein